MKVKKPSFKQLEKIMDRGWAQASCTQCSRKSKVEPDADYPCTTEGCKGRLTSPLVLMGLI